MKQPKLKQPAKKQVDQAGFIPMMICLLSVIVILIVIAYLHVRSSR